MNADGASFRNLDFELCPDFPAGDNQHPFTIYANALPSWVVRIGTNSQSGACANEFILDAPAVALLTSSGFLPPIEGQKSVYLQSTATLLFNPTSVVNVSISQTGLVPTNSQFLRFKARNQWYGSFPIPPGPFEVRLNQQTVPLVVLRSDGGDAEYAAEVSAWAGQTAELSLKVLASTNWGNASFPEGWALVDSISFQPGVLLNISTTGTNTLNLSWPTNAVDSLHFAVFQCSDLISNTWEKVANIPIYANGTNTVTLPLPPAPRYFRLETQP